MTDSNYTHLKLVVDRSGSMGARVAGSPREWNSMWTAHVDYATVANNLTKAINDLFAEQAKVEGTCLVDYAQFDTEYELVYEDRPVKIAKGLIQPRGSTALLDAIGKAITELGAKLSAMPEERRPGKVMLVIVTDGYENASVEYTRSRIKEMITEQTDKYNWNVVFLGANMDAVAEAATFGVKAGSSLTYDVNNVAAGTQVLSSYATNYRTTGSAAFSDDDRKSAVSK